MADKTTANAPAADPTALEKPGIGGYISFILAVVFFSGLCETKEWWGIFDFTVVNGSFGQLLSSVKDQAGELITATSSFRGKGGSGAIDGFMFALTLEDVDDASVFLPLLGDTPVTRGTFDA